MAVKAGCDDFLTKPVNNLELKTRVRSLLRVRHLTNERDRLLAYLEEVEKNHIHQILDRTGWRVRGRGGAADALGLKPTTLDSKMKKLGIKRDYSKH